MRNKVRRVKIRFNYNKSILAIASDEDRKFQLRVVRRDFMRALLASEPLGGEKLDGECEHG